MFNTEEVFHVTATELLARRGKTATPEVFQSMMGRRADEAFANLVRLMELKDSIDHLKQESSEIFLASLEEHLAPMPGLWELLHRIESLGLPKGVATSSDRKYLTYMLGRFELLERFDITLTAEDVTHGKPHPEIYLTAAKKLNVTPDQMLVLEDSEAGSKAAAAAGAHIISVPHRHSSSHDFTLSKGVATSLVDPMILNLLKEG